MRKLFIFVLVIVALMVAGCGSTSSNKTATPSVQTTTATTVAVKKKKYTAEDVVNNIPAADIADFCESYVDLGAELGNPVGRDAFKASYNDEARYELALKQGIEVPSADDVYDELVSRC